MKKLTKIFIFSLLFGFAQLSAQAILIEEPVPADNPNLSGNSPWPAICAGNANFNEYFVLVEWSGTANPANEFVLELSSATGDFSSPVNLATITDQNSNTKFDVGFSIPTTTRGDGYKMRIRSTDPVKIGKESPAYSMYYMDVTKSLNISVLGDGVPPGSICSTDAITLKVDNIVNPDTYGYLWYRSGTLLTGETGHTLNVTQSGMYVAYIDYGDVCTGSGNTDSNLVDVNIGGSGNDIAVTPPLKTALCSTDSETLSINKTDSTWGYQWYKDGNKIAGAVSTSYNVNASIAGFEGDYTVEIYGNDICNEMSAAVSITNAEAYEVTLVNDVALFLLPSLMQTISISTTANMPTFKWFRNGAEVLGETTNSITVSQPGEYYASVTQSGGVCSVTSKNSETTTVKSPSSFEFVIDYSGTYTSCESTSANLGLQKIDAITADGSAIDVTDTLKTVFNYQWVKDGVDEAGVTNDNIGITSNIANGDYVLMGSLDAYTVTSNTLPVQLLTNQTLNITSTGTVFCSVTDALTISTTTDLSSGGFQWLLDGDPMNTTDAILNVASPGTYQLLFNVNGCPLLSNEIKITSLDPSLITLSEGPEIIVPRGTSTTITASGGTSYRWFNDNNTEIESTDTVTILDEGVYTLVASVDNCEVIKQVEVKLLDIFKVPNVITVNGDGINDQWVIPNNYANQEDINVIIYNEQGQELLNVFDYKNNWPQTSVSFKKQNMVFYYKIRNANKVLKQGTITVIK